MESHGGDDAGWGKLLTHPPELWQSYQQRYLGESRKVRILNIRN
jgi:hypothetical protein